MFERVALISIPVSDQAVARQFYTERLGCAVVQELPFGPDTLWIRLALPGTTTDIVLATWFPQMKPGSLQGLVVTTGDIARTHAELRRRQLEISEVERRPWGQEATFQDPDGNGWILQQPGAQTS